MKLNGRTSHRCGVKSSEVTCTRIETKPFRDIKHKFEVVMEEGILKEEDR
jgi:hypothetical protein